MKLIILISLILSMELVIGQSCFNYLNNFKDPNCCVVVSVAGVNKDSMAQEGLMGYLRYSNGRLSQINRIIRLQTYETDCSPRGFVQPFFVDSALYSNSFNIDISKSTIEINGVTSSLFCSTSNYPQFLQNSFLYTLILKPFSVCPKLSYGEVCRNQTLPPTQTPTQYPTQTPTSKPPCPNCPTSQPTQTPTQTPTQKPTQTPTQYPTYPPTQTPTSKPPCPNCPTIQPTQTPTQTPTQKPTQYPTFPPTDCDISITSRIDNEWDDAGGHWIQYGVFISNNGRTSIKSVEFNSDNWAPKDFWSIVKLSNGNYGLPSYVQSIEPGQQHSFGFISTTKNPSFRVINYN